jgi:hypothetical protein
MSERGVKFSRFGRKTVFFSFAFLFVFPASTNYRLDGYGFGSGGEENMASSNYAIDGITGEQVGDQLQGTNYDLGAGLIFTQQANVPQAPTFTNPSDFYNKLHIVLATGDNSADTKFAIAISDDNWTTTEYVQNDNTIGATLGIEDRQIFAAWGGGSGFDVIGLAPGTTYKVKVKAMQGRFTETGYGPEASAATVNPQLSFDIDVAATDTDTNPPFSVTFGSLVANTVTDSPEKIWVDFSTNGASGGRVYVSGSNGGLSSTRAAALITAATGDLSALASGYGAQGQSATEGSGGPFSIVAPYNGVASTVGIVDASIREVFSTTAPIVSGRASFLLKAKSSAVTPAAGDYADTLTVIASASF